MQFLKYLIENKNIESTMIGFSINDSDIKRQYKYIESWLIRYKIAYDKVENNHISMAMITDKINKDELIRDINIISKQSLVFKFKKYTILEGRDWDFIAIELKRNPQFLKLFNDMDNKYNLIKFKDEIRPHISLFKTKKGELTKEFFNEIIENAPVLKNVKTKKVELWNNKFSVEFSKRMI